MANGIIHQKQCLKEFRHPASTNFDEIWKFKPQYEVKKIQIGIARRKKKVFFFKYFIENSRKWENKEWRGRERSREYEGGNRKSEDSVSDFSLAWFALGT